MPPRLPHGLKKGPFEMNTPEKLVLGLLGTSMLGGLLHLATSPLYSKDKSGQEGSHHNGNAGEEKEKPYIFKV